MTTLVEAAKKERQEALVCQRRGRRDARDAKVRHWAYQAIGNLSHFEFCNLSIDRSYKRIVVKLDGETVFESREGNIVVYKPGDWVEALKDLAMAAPTKRNFACA